jgi:hypothetical protein
MFTRPDIAAVQVTTAKTTASAVLTTGSPASISQTVSSVTSDNLQFKYQFATTSGQLKVTLNGVELGVFDAPSSLDGLFTTVNLDTSAFLGELNAVLTFTLDSLTAGSSILIDDIIFANLVNPDFQTGNLTGWTASSSGAGSVGIALAVEQTPLPGALLLFASGLGVMGVLGRRRRRANPITKAA